MKLDYTQSITDNSNITLTPASAMTGGGKNKKQSGGGYVGVSFLPERSIGGMPQRLGFGPRCTPFFRGYPDPLYQAGGGKEKPCDCDEKKLTSTMTEKEAQSASLGELSGLMFGGSPISQFSTIAASSSIFAPININQIISIILLLFGHAYLTRSSASPKKSSSHRDRILGGGSVEASQTESQQEIRGGGSPLPLLAPILMPLGPNNLVAIAAILLLHYFATRRERMISMKGGSKSMELFQSESLFEKEMKIHQMLGGNSLYRELEESFLTIESSSDGDLLGGGVKGKLRGTREKRKGKIAALIKPIGHARFKAQKFIRDLKNLFRHYYYTIYKEKTGGKNGRKGQMDGGSKLAKGKQMAHSKRAVRSFQRIYDMIAPIAVALKLKKEGAPRKK